MKVRVWWASSSISSSPSEQEQPMHFMLGTLCPCGPVWLGFTVSYYSRPTQPVPINFTSSGSNGGGDVPATDGTAGWRLDGGRSRGHWEPTGSKGLPSPTALTGASPKCSIGTALPGRRKVQKGSIFEGYETSRISVLSTKGTFLMGYKGQTKSTGLLPCTNSQTQRHNNLDRSQVSWLWTPICCQDTRQAWERPGTSPLPRALCSATDTQLSTQTSPLFHPLTSSSKVLRHSQCFFWPEMLSVKKPPDFPGSSGVKTLCF